MKQSRWIVLNAAITVGICSCGTAAPVAPRPDIAPPTLGIVSGKVLRAPDGAPLEGVRVVVDKTSVSSGPDGSFVASGTPTYVTRVPVRAFGSAVVDRELDILVGPQPSTLTLDLIPAAFLPFYRQFVRDGYENPTPLQSIRRWQRDPSFFINTTIQDDGNTVPPAVIAEVQRVLAASVPELTGSRFRARGFEIGTETRPLTAGWINVTFWRELPKGALGNSLVGIDPGIISLVYDPNLDLSGRSNPTNCSSVTAAVAEHEVVHALGFWHTDDNRDFRTGEGCPGVGRPERARTAAAIAYSRPVSNRDPDRDPASALDLNAVFSVISPPMSCTVQWFR